MSRIVVTKTIRRFCLECEGGSARAVRLCADKACALRAWRLPAGSDGEGNGQDDADDTPTETAQPMAAGPADLHAASSVADTVDTAIAAPATAADDTPEGEASAPDVGATEPLRAIRRFCMVCCGGRGNVRACDARDVCPLWSFRFGVQPETFRRVKARQHGPRVLVLPGLK